MTSNNIILLVVKTDKKKQPILKFISLKKTCKKL